jgi:hypothetical protein
MVRGFLVGKVGMLAQSFGNTSEARIASVLPVYWQLSLLLNPTRNKEGINQQITPTLGLRVA